jgi:hypothetical protein
MACWSILWTFWYNFPILVCCTHKNLAALLLSSTKLASKKKNALILKSFLHNHLRMIGSEEPLSAMVIEIAVDQIVVGSHPTTVSGF